MSSEIKTPNSIPPHASPSLSATVQKNIPRETEEFSIFFNYKLMIPLTIEKKNKIISEQEK
jgi:hypothetical protein